MRRLLRGFERRLGRHLGLARRFAALTLTVFLGVQVLAFVVLRETIDQAARGRVEQQLAHGEAAFAEMLETTARRLHDTSGVLAADFGFREALLSGDRATVSSALDNHRERVGAAFAFSADPAGRLTGAAGLDDAQQAAIERLLRGTPVQSLQRQVVGVRGRPYVITVSPVRAPILMAHLVLGFELNDAVLESVKRASGLDVQMSVGGRSAGAENVPASTLPAPRARALAAADAGAGPLVLQGERHGVRRVPLGGTLEPVAALLVGSIDAAVAPYRALQVQLLVLTLIGTAVAGAASVWAARRVVQPVGRLVEAAQRLAGGDYDSPVQGGHRSDEIGHLARVFDGMRQSVAAQRLRIMQLAYEDPLTGLASAARLRMELEQAVAASSPAQERWAVAVIDLDGFKRINDALGMEQGDRLLRELAQRLRAEAPEARCLARWAGDEFAMMWPAASADEALGRARHWEQRLHRPYALDGRDVDVRVDVGVALWPEAGPRAHQVLAHAEVAVQRAKRRKLGPEVFQPSAFITRAAAVELDTLSRLRRALEQGQLCVYLQPKVRLRDARLVGAEALVRWRDPQRGLVPPMQFIPLAEHSGFVREITAWVLGACADAAPALFGEAGAALPRVSVNVSVRDLSDPALPQRLLGRVQAADVPPHRFCLEITESAIMDDPEHARATLETLVAAGFELAIDDYGSGNTSIGYLRQLPVQELKLDMSLVRGLMRSAGDGLRRGADEIIVASTIEMAHELRMTVVAEGVEDEAAWQRLRQLNCDVAQGYHLSRPLPLDEFVAWSRAWRMREQAVMAASEQGGQV